MVRWISAALAAFAVAMATPSFAADVSAYGRLPAIDMVTLSPSGSRLAYVTVAGEQRRLVVLELPEKTLVNVPVGDTKVRDVSWAGDDHVLVEISNTQSETFDFRQAEYDQVLSVNVNTQNTVAVFYRAETVFHAVLGRFGVAQIDGRWYGFFGGVTLMKQRGFDPELIHGYPDLYKVDLDSGVEALVAHGNLLDHNWVVDGAGVIVAHSDYDQDTGSWALYADGAGHRLLDKEADPLGQIAIRGMGRTPGSLLVDNGHVEEWNLASGSHAPLPSVGLRPIDSVLHDRNTHLAIGVVLEGSHEVVLFDVAAQARYSAIEKALARRTGLDSWSADFKRLVVATDGKGDSGTYWLIDGAQANIIDNPYPDVPATAVGDSQMINFKAADGLEIQGVLTIPQGRNAHNLPVVVLPHGGPEAYDTPEFDWWAQAFTSQGYAVFQPNYRGSSGYGQAFRDAGYGEWGRKMQTDISDGLAELARRGVIDPKRACIVGGSYGGYAALAGVTVQQGLYRCAISVAGVSDLNAFLAWKHERRGDDPSDATRYWRKFMGANSDSDSALRAFSPAQLADKADAPILLIHGQDDTVVPIEQSRIMETALRKAGKSVEFVTMKSEDHWLSREASRKAMLAAAVNFVIKHNPSDPPSASVAAATAPGSSR